MGRKIKGNKRWRKMGKTRVEKEDGKIVTVKRQDRVKE